MIVNPIYLSNRNGIPRIQTSAVTVTDTSVNFTVPSNLLFSNYYNGLILLKIAQTVSSSGSSLPVNLVSAVGGSQAVTTLGGTLLTGSGATLGIHLAYYESNTGTLQLIA